MPRFRTDDLIIGTFMVALIIFGTYMSYRPHRVPVSSPITAPIIAPLYS